MALRFLQQRRRSATVRGDELDPDPKLDAAEALANWTAMAQPADAGPSDWLAAARATDAEDIRRLRAERFTLLARR